MIIVTISIGLFLIALSIVAPYLLTRPSSNISFSNTGQIGDTIGGLTAPVLAILGSFLTFMAFYIQYTANKIQIDNIEVLRKKDQLEAYENKVLSMLQMHRKNVEELYLDTGKDTPPIRGQEFILFIRDQLEEIYKILKYDNELNKKEKTQLCYLYIFYGNSLVTTLTCTTAIISFFTIKLTYRMACYIRMSLTTVVGILIYAFIIMVMDYYFPDILDSNFK
ncbi:hypothetical protein [Sediminispirochaeta smaragdinae]|uniref:hypothetical protein n=1 Tax=Sediminispirochaeta smaragdinae TaxID=55206 RepID=UPI001FDF2CBB|nr:hypothetical protein [Sediminispirochaeta smaragdinae]